MAKVSVKKNFVKQPRDKNGRFVIAGKKIPAKKVTSSKKKPSSKKVELQRDYILLDRSGSMSSLWAEALGSVNTYVRQLKDDKVNTKVTVAVFDGHNSFDVIRNDVDPGSWNEISNGEVSPRGMTPYYDAIGKVVARANEKNPDKVAIIIMTDGHENASREYTKDSARKLLDACRAKNWQIIFLGADFDNATQATDMGSKKGTNTKVVKGKLDKAMGFAATSRSAYGLTGASMSYSDAERKYLSR